MDAELKAKWVAALRSGEHKQCQRTYYDRATDAHCCLNVLAFVDTGNKEQPSRRASEDKVGDSNLIHKFIAMNDGAGEWEGKPQSFAQIADFIEANL